jgi:hypothetical protein
MVFEASAGGGKGVLIEMITGEGAIWYHQVVESVQPNRSLGGHMKPIKNPKSSIT